MDEQYAWVAKRMSSSVDHWEFLQLPLHCDPDDLLRCVLQQLEIVMQKLENVWALPSP